MQNEPLLLLAIIAALAVVVVAAVLAFRNRQQHRSAELQQHFGPEYDRLLAEHGDRARAEKELSSRQKRLEELDIKLLSPEQCERFGLSWSRVQQRFVDDPSGAVVEADGLVKEVMRARGYPIGNFEQRVADLSVEHARVIDHYRAARELALASANGQAGTEEQRQAMVHFRALFTDLLQAHSPYAPLRQSHA